MTRRGAALFTAMCVIWGVPYLLIRVAVRDLAPVDVVFLRTGGAAVLLLPAAACRGELWPAVRRWRAVGGFAVVEIAGPWLLLAHAEQRLPSATAGLLVATVPLFGVALARVFGNARLDGRRLAGLFIGLIGVVPLVGIDVTHLDVVAAVEVLGTAAGYATGPFIVSRYLADTPSLGVIGCSLGVSAVGYAALAVPRLPHHVTGETISAMTVLTLLCTAAAFILFFALIRDIGPASAGVITYVNPAVAIALGVALLGERLTPGMLAGFPLVLLGSTLAARGRGQGSPPAPSPPAATQIAALAVEGPLA